MRIDRDETFLDGELIEVVEREVEDETTPPTVEALLPTIASLEKQVNELQAKLGIAQTPDSILGKIRTALGV